MFVKDLILDILKKYDKKASNKVLKTIEEVEANTDSNNIAGADVTAEIISNLSADGVPFRFGVDSDGNYGYILQDGEGGADAVHPFSRKLIFGGYIGSYVAGTSYKEFTFPHKPQIIINCDANGVSNFNDNKSIKWLGAIWSVTGWINSHFSDTMDAICGGTFFGKGLPSAGNDFNLYTIKKVTDYKFLICASSSSYYAMPVYWYYEGD